MFTPPLQGDAAEPSCSLAYLIHKVEIRPQIRHVQLAIVDAREQTARHVAIFAPSPMESDSIVRLQTQQEVRNQSLCALQIDKLFNQSAKIKISNACKVALEGKARYSYLKYVYTQLPDCCAHIFNAETDKSGTFCSALVARILPLKAFQSRPSVTFTPAEVFKELIDALNPASTVVWVDHSWSQMQSEGDRISQIPIKTHF